MVTIELPLAGYTGQGLFRLGNSSLAILMNP